MARTNPTGRPRVEVDPALMRRMPYGLLANAQVVDMGEGPWQIGGVTYPSLGLCGVGQHVWPGPCGSLEKPVEKPEPIEVTAVYSYAKTPDENGLYPLLVKVTTKPKAPLPDGVAVSVRVPGGGWTSVAPDTEEPVRVGTADPDTGSFTVRARLSGPGTGPEAEKDTTLDKPPAGSAVLSFVVDPATPPEDGSKHRDGGPAWVVGDPFAIYATAACLPAAGFKDGASALARSRLDAGEQCALEQRLWTLLGRAKPTVTLDGGMTLLDGVSSLEEEAARCLGAQPTLHLPSGLTWGLACAQGLWRDGPNLRTPLGSPISFGLCYDPRRGPGGRAPAEKTDVPVYATGPVTIRRGPLVEYEQFSTKTNEYLAVAERVYVLTWDCCLVSGVISKCGGLECES